jgi:CHAT domain-containing protein
LVAQANSALGEIYSEEKSFAEALTYVDKAVEASLAKGANLSPEGLPDIHTADFPYELLYALGVKANILRDLQGKNASVADLQKSLKVYDLSIALLKKLQKTYKRGTNKYQIAELGQRFALEALKTCIFLYDRTQNAEYQRLGFMYSEFSKSILLVEALSELRSRQIQGLPAEFLEVENELKQQQNFLETEIYYEVKKGKKSDVVRLAALRKQLGYVQSQYQNHLAQAQQKYPQYYQLRYEISIADIPTVQQNLDPAEALLEYSVLSDSALVVFVVTKNDFRWHRQNLPFSLSKKIIEWKGNNKKYLLDLVKVSYELYQQLIEPLALNLQTTRLRIIPDAELHYLPFDALNTQLLKPTNDQSFQFLEKHTFLMYKYSCVYNYTATVWLEYRKLEQKNTPLRTILGMAPDFSLSQDNTVAFSAINNHLGTSFGDIPAARVETNNIVGWLKGDSIMGLAATETTFKQKAANYRILHLATHGAVNTQNPLYSAIILMGDDANDGLLHAHELYNLQLSAELVVLSACETGAGKLAKGEGIASIARAFAYAGAPNVVMSMWAAVDDIARLVMERFYIKLEEGLPKDQALQQAKLEVYDLLPNEGRMPYYWAGFVLIGDTSPLQMNPPMRWHFWLAGALGLAGFVGVGVWLRKKNI